MKEKRGLTVFLLGVIPFLSLFGFIALKFHAHKIVSSFPTCMIHKYTGLYCPACGNTRSVLSLLDGNLFLSLRYNITPFTIGLLLIILYIEATFYALGHPLKILPRSNRFWFIILTIILLYYLVRNFVPALVGIY